MKTPRDDLILAPYDDGDEFAEHKGPAIDVMELVLGVGRRWKLIVCLTLLGLAAGHMAARQLRPLYKSAVEVLVYDPQRQIDLVIQKPISAFESAIGFDAINTEVPSRPRAGRRNSRPPSAC